MQQTRSILATMRIALVSDSHLTPRTSAFSENWATVATWIDKTAPDLVVHLGDITMDGVSDPGELDTAFPAFASVGRPMWFLPGNHDIGDNPLETGPSSDHPFDRERLTHYRRVFGSDWWALEADAWQIVGLNAQLFSTGTEEEEAQFAWLDDQLRDAGRPVGVVLHKPLFRNRPEDTEAHIRYVPARARRRLLACLATCDLRFVIASTPTRRVGSTSTGSSTSGRRRLPSASPTPCRSGSETRRWVY
jgi:Calcineurin-like phosphoesterase